MLDIHSQIRAVAIFTLKAGFSGFPVFSVIRLDSLLPGPLMGKKGSRFEITCPPLGGIDQIVIIIERLADRYGESYFVKSFYLTLPSPCITFPVPAPSRDTTKDFQERLDRVQWRAIGYIQEVKDSVLPPG